MGFGGSSGVGGSGGLASVPPQRSVRYVLSLATSGRGRQRIGPNAEGRERNISVKGLQAAGGSLIALC